MLEKGRLYSLRKDGTEDSVYLNIKNKRFLFGSSECCTVRMYIDGIFPEHCVLTVGEQEKVCLEPLHPSALILVNGIKIKHKVFLKDRDVITIFIKKFLFTYPLNGLSGNISSERLLVLPYSKQLKSQKFEMPTLIKSWETSCPFSESSVSSIQYIPKKQICLVESDTLKKTPSYVLQFFQQEPLNILDDINAQEFNCFSDKPLIKYMNPNVNESSESRRNLALKLHEFISFVRGLLNKNAEYLCDLYPILEFVWKYCIARGSEDILFLPLKYVNLKEELNALKKSLPSRILLYTPENSSPISKTILEKEHGSIDSLEVSTASTCKINEQKRNQYASRKTSISYKKRVSLAVKRYHFRRRKSIVMANPVESGNDENLELSDKKGQVKNGCKENNSKEQDDALNLEKQKSTAVKKKRDYKKKEKETLHDKAELKKKEIHTEVVMDAVEKLNSSSEPMKEKRRNKKATVKKTDLDADKENIAELIENSSENQATLPTLRQKKQVKKNHKNRGPKESIDSAVEQTNATNLTEAKSTKRSYKRKKKETVTDFKDEVEIKLTLESPMKQHNPSDSNELKSKRVNYKKKEKSLQTELCMKNNSDHSKQKQDTQEVSNCQRVTRSMAKSRH